MTVVVCPKCLYEWDTESTALWVTCPNCMRKSIQQMERVFIELEKSRLNGGVGTE